MKRTSLTALLAASVLAVLAVGLFAGVASASSSSPAASTKVVVAASDFKFVLSRKAVPAGTVTFVVTNKGKTTHDFKIGGKKTKMLAPGKAATLKLVLKKGKYTYICTVPGHAAAGMKGVFVVR